MYWQVMLMDNQKEILFEHERFIREAIDGSDEHKFTRGDSVFGFAKKYNDYRMVCFFGDKNYSILLEDNKEIQKKYVALLDKYNLNMCKMIDIIEHHFNQDECCHKYVNMTGYWMLEYILF